jgi:hypothetical protein
MNMIKKIMNLKYFLGLALILSACIEEEGDSISGKGINKFRYSTPDFSVVTLKPFSIENKSVISIYRDAVSKSSMNESVTLELLISQDSLDAYNDREGTSFLLLDPAWYELSINPGTITFAPGESVKTIRIEIDTNPFDLTEKYALPFVIKDPSGNYEIANSGSLAIVQTLPINKYDGVYEVTEGTMVDVTTGTLTHINDYRNSPGALVTGNQQYALITSGEKDCDVFDWDFFGNYYSPITSSGSYSRYGNFSAVFHFDTDDKIESVTNYWGQPNPSNGRYASVDPAATNQWSPAGIEGVGYFMHHPSAVPTPPHIRTTWAETWVYLEPR